MKGAQGQVFALGICETGVILVMKCLSRRFINQRPDPGPW